MIGVKETGLRLRVDLSHRSVETEWLDSTDIDPKELEDVLHDLARFDKAMLGHVPIFRWLRRAVGKNPGAEPVSLVDVGCGYGELLRAIRRWSRRRGLSLDLCGLDLNPETIRIARAATNASDRIDFRVANIFNFQPGQPVDLIVSNLVTHHFSDQGIVTFLRWMETTARRGWSVCDLQRNIVPYTFIGLVGKLSRIHPVVMSDGRISVARSLTRPEWRELLDAAAIPRNSVAIRWFLFRHLVGRIR